MTKLVAVLLVLSVAGAAGATPVANVNIYYPDATSWQLYMMEVDDAAPTVPSGYGIRNFAITVRGADWCRQ